MWELAQLGLSFVSAALVALMILGFSSVFFLFSASALLVFARFLAFARSVHVGVPSALAAGLLAGLVAWGSGLPNAIAVAGAQAFATLLVWLVLRTRQIRRWIGRLLALALVGAALLFVADLLGAHSGIGMSAMGAAVSLLAAIAVAAAPLLVVGVFNHLRRQRVEWMIAFRYLTAGRENAPLSLATGVSAAGISLGVALLTVVLAVFNGFADVIEQRLIGASGHIAILAPASSDDRELAPIAEQVGRAADVVAVTSFVTIDAIARGANGKLQPMRVEGVALPTVDGVLELRANVRLGSVDDLASGDPPGIVIGTEAARLLEAHIGEKLALLLPQSQGLGNPRLAPFRVVAISDFGMFELNRQVAFASSDAIRELAQATSTSGLRLRVASASTSYQIAHALAREIGATRPDLLVRDWSSSFPGLFQSLHQQRVLLFMILSFILLVASFTIVSTLIMTIMSKERDIGLLKALGCTDDAILRIFALQGFLIGMAGLLGGVVCGLVIADNLPSVQSVLEWALGIDVLPAEVYQFSTLAWKTSSLQLGAIAILTLFLAVGATLAPSRQASRLDPATSLRGA